MTCGGNAVLRARPQTLHALPWATRAAHRVGQVLCETAWLDGRPQASCPRYVAGAQLDRLADMGYLLKSAFECEFILVGAEKTGRLFEMLSDKYESLMCTLDAALAASGVDGLGPQFEYAPGQFEVPLNTAIGIKAADMAFLFKAGTREICAQHGYEATFMARPEADEVASGFHFNHSLIDKSGKRAMYDGDRPDNLATVTRQWLAGLMKHAGALTALCSPTVNCYRRMHSPWAPHAADWGIDHRLTTFRVKNVDAEQTYVENRIPSAACNPYLVLAATVAAGMDGIRNALECPANRTTAEPQSTDPLLPRTLDEALRALQDDAVMVEALGEEFVGWFVRLKTELEIEKLVSKDAAEKMQMEKDLYLAKV